MTQPEFREVGHDDFELFYSVRNLGRGLLVDDWMVQRQIATVDTSSVGERELVYLGEALAGATSRGYVRGRADFQNMWAGVVRGAPDGLEDALFHRVEGAARAAGAERISSVCTSQQPERVEFLRGRGYRLLEVGNISMRSLAASSLAGPLAAATERLRRDGIELTTLGARPELTVAAHALNVAAEHDVPSDAPMPIPTLDEWLRQLDAPWYSLDRVWLAVEGDQPVAITVLVVEPVTGNAWTAMTGTAPSHRGRGLAHAVKLRCLADAAAAGVRRAFTYNDERNHPMLAVNRRLGYEVVAQELRHHIDVV